MKNNEKIAIKVSVISIILNCLLTLIKFISGVISKSSAMISDSVHSLSDVLSTFVVIIGVKISNKRTIVNQADKQKRGWALFMV